MSDPEDDARAGRRWTDADRLTQLGVQVQQIDRSLRDISAHLMQHLEQERSAEGRVSDLAGRCAGIEGELRSAREQFGTLSTRVDRLAASVESCVAALNLARGGWGAVVVIATALVAIGGAIAWVWDHIRS